MSSATKKKKSSLLDELTRVGLYKKNQGRLTRQLTALALLLVVAFGLWRLANGPLSGFGDSVRLGIPIGLFVASAWVIYRVVNYPRFADFLISVEAEMDKVTWSSRAELYRATIVVLVTMVFMAALLFLYDEVWRFLFRWIGFS